MGFLGEFMDGMPAVLLICIGITAMIGVVHLWLSRASWDANAWVAVWAGLACVFLGARGVQLTTQEPENALLAGKIAIAVAPYLVWALIGFGRNLGERGLERSTLTVLATISVAWTLGILGTSWFVDSLVTTRTDFFGRSHLSVHALWPAHLLSLYFAGALVWGVRRLRKQSQLEPGERRMLVLSLSIYAALGISAVLTSVGLISVPAAAEFGPVVVAITLSYMMAQRRRRVEIQLEELLKEKSSRLAQSEERYQDLVEHAPIGVFVIDDEDRVSALNPRMVEMLGQLDGSDLEQVIARTGLREIAQRSISDSQVQRVEHRIETKGTEAPRMWSVTTSPLGDEAQPSQALVLADDTTERYALERQLLQSRKMDSIGRLVAGVAHEINNPMAYVRANLSSIDRHRQTLQKGWEAFGHSSEQSKQMEALDDLEALVDESIEGVEKTIRIVQDMGGLVLPEPPAQAPIALSPLIQESLRLHEAIRGESVEVLIGPLADVSVSAAPSSLRQVFDHLLANAEEAVAGEGRIEVESLVLPDEYVKGESGLEAAGRSEASQVLIRVTDDGPGIPEEARAHLFDPFFTVRESTGSTGLGLYVAYQTVRSLGGDLRYVDTGSDQQMAGACFEVLLPIG